MVKMGQILERREALKMMKKVHRHHHPSQASPLVKMRREEEAEHFLAKRNYQEKVALERMTGM